jgi:saccharopine dehydrogenase (NAD+, L-lysine-forming)
MDACLACGVNYMDTANYEPENTDDPEWRAIYEKRCKEAGFSAYFDYSWQWAYKKKFEEAGLTALLGCGFDPGVTQAYCAYAKKHEFDTIDTIDILDCNGGDHGYAFATNFNPEINLREVSAPGSYWENGHWVEIPAMSIKRAYTFDQVGQKDMYLLHHEEIESLGKNLPEVKRIRFFMTFGQSYLDHMRCLEDVGMLSTTPIHYNGQEIVPIQFLKALLPDPASLGPRTKGKTNIGCIFTGKKDGKEKTYYIYNVCDHQECYREVGSQAISYTTGVPAMCGALMMLTGKWTKPGVYTVEEFDPDPFLDALDKYGLPRSESHKPGPGGLMAGDKRPFLKDCPALSAEPRSLLCRSSRRRVMCWMKQGCYRRNAEILASVVARTHRLQDAAGAEGLFQLSISIRFCSRPISGNRSQRACLRRASVPKKCPDGEVHVFLRSLP